MSANNTTEEQEGGFWRETARTWGVAILAVILIRGFIFEPFRIPSGSMVPTLLIGDHVIVTKFSYGIWVPFTDIELIDLDDPAVGDVIVFKYPRDPSLNYIKRVVAVPGDKIAVRNNIVTINGKLVNAQKHPAGAVYSYLDDRCVERSMNHKLETVGGVEHSILTHTFGGRLNQEEITVPPDNVFVMGDNRDNSQDSREWGFVKYDQIKGKAHLVWMSWDSCTTDGFMRSERFFKSLYDPA